jgi:hypothetical protein
MKSRKPKIAVNNEERNIAQALSLGQSDQCIMRTCQVNQYRIYRTAKVLGLGGPNSARRQYRNGTSNIAAVVGAATSRIATKALQAAVSPKRGRRTQFAFTLRTRR